MNIIEAVKSGKSLRRMGWGEGVFITPPMEVYFNKGDILADDWMFYEETHRLSWEEIEIAVLRHMNMAKDSRSMSFNASAAKKELGFS